MLSSAGSGDRPRCYALVPCAGAGERAGPGGPKQYRSLAGRSVVAHTLAALARVPRIVATLVVVAPDDGDFERHAPALEAWVARVGGATRAASVAGGLSALLERGAGPEDWVLVHDAARCLVQPADIERLIAACEHDGVGGLLALSLADTLKRAAEPGVETLPGGGDTLRVAATVDRRALWQAQTPQMFRIGRLREALAAAGDRITDEAGAIEALGDAPLLVPGSLENFKLTWPADFALAERLLRARA
jgi:2-C-methyl-D-erythritol 4-phosphate cytidylyltransferase